jgi:hypothetical protein
MTVYLVPASRGRHELYSEAPDATPDAAPPAGRVRRWIAALSENWRELTESAQRGRGGGRLARWRDRAICAVAESIAEQRTLWALRQHGAAVVRMPSSIAAADARSWLMAELSHARRHHLRWLAIDSTLLVVSGVLALVPGPNLIAYYFAFRVVGHLQSWRGARQGMDRIEWTFAPDDGLAELAGLVNEPREARAPRVGAIAERLNLPHLAAFFDRVAVPSA